VLIVRGGGKRGYSIIDFKEEIKEGEVARQASTTRKGTGTIEREREEAKIDTLKKKEMVKKEEPSIGTKARGTGKERCRDGRRALRRRTLFSKRAGRTEERIKRAQKVKRILGKSSPAQIKDNRKKGHLIWGGRGVWRGSKYGAQKKGRESVKQTGRSSIKRSRASSQWHNQGRNAYERREGTSSRGLRLS